VAHRGRRPDDRIAACRRTAGSLDWPFDSYDILGSVVDAAGSLRQSLEQLAR
jgi:hypothetical protein